MRLALLKAVRAHPALWLALALGFVAAYHALLLAAMVARFGHAPNFMKVYDVVESYRLILTGTPSLRDALAIAAGEPWLDIGYMSPTWRISEWSLMILPPHFLLVALTGCLVATVVTVRRAGNVSCRWSSTLAATVGAGLAGVANATLFWVVCCATPTWIVGLAMMGVSVSVAFMLEPLGPLLTATGVALLVWATLVQLNRIAAPAAPPFVPVPAPRSA